jgi:hypothetical protein
MEKSSHWIDEEMKGVKFTQFQESDFSHITTIHSFSLYSINSALLGATKVIHLVLNYYTHEEPYFNQLLAKSNFLKIRSKYFLKRLGYISDKRNKALTLVYERPEGKVLDFETIYDFGDNELLRLFIYQQMLNIISRLKKAGVTLGHISPNLFFFDSYSTKPLMLMEFNLLSIYNKINDPVVKLSFGYFKYSHSNDLAMLLILLAKLFIEDVPFEVLIYKFYLEFIGRQALKGNTFTEIVNNIPNKHVRDFIKKYKDRINDPRTKNNIPKIEEECEQLNKFQADFKELYLTILKSRPCGHCGQNEAEGVAQICYEVLCSECEVTHQCPKKALFDLQINKLKLENNMIRCAEIDSNFMSLPKFTINSEAQVKKFYKTFDKIIIKQTEMPLIAQHRLDQPLTNLANNILFSKKTILQKCDELEKALVEYNKNKNKEKETELEQQLSVIQSLVNNMEKSAELLKNFDNNSEDLKKIVEIISNYQLTLQYYKTMVVRSIFDDSLKHVKVCLNNKSNIIRTNSLGGVIVDYIFNRKEIDEFYIPIFETNKLMGITDISPDGLEYTKEEIEIKFKDDITVNYFPNELQWTRMFSFLFICGGVTKGDERVKPNLVNNAWILNLTNYDLYSLPPMLSARHNHSLVKYNKIFIVAISGTNTPTCEMFNLTKNEWLPLPSLKKPRSNSTVVMYNRQFLYCIGGTFGQSYCNNIEVLDMIKRSAWVEHQIDGSSCSYGLINAGVMKNEAKDVILLLGGKDAQTGAISEDMYEFSFETFLISQKENKMPYACYFYDRNLKKSNKRTQIAFTYDNLEMLMRIEI